VLLHRLEVGLIFSATGCIVDDVPSLSGRHGGGSMVEGLASFILAQRASYKSCSPAAFRQRVSAITSDSKDVGHPLPAASTAPSRPTALAQVVPSPAPVR
jgi:hypothetical protein